MEIDLADVSSDGELTDGLCDSESKDIDIENERLIFKL